jgi:hypothetical protein
MLGCENLLGSFGEAMTKQTLIREIEQIPDHLVEEVLDFVQFLNEKHLKEKRETAILSEVVLAQDWLTPEEEVAWQDL